VKDSFLSSSFRISLLRNSFIVTICWIIFFPGFYSGDSFGAVDMARSGNLTNSYTASWALYVRIFSLFGNAIGLLTLLGGLLLVFATTHLAYALFEKITASISSFLISLTPIVWGMGITLWHDIQMTSGMLLVATFMIKVHRSQSVSPLDIVSQLILGSLLLSFRPNGLPTLLIFSFLYLAIIRKRVVIRYLLIAVSSTVLITLITSNFILGLNPINNYYAQEWMRNDISCFADSPKGLGFVERKIPGIGNTENWKSAAACKFLNQAKLTYEEKVRAEKFVPSAWVSLVKEEPRFVLNTHIERNAYLIPLPLNGIPNPPFLHSSIEFKDQNIEWAFPAIAEKARAPIRLWNLFRSFTAWAGIWSVITLVLLLGFKKREQFVPFLMSLSLIVVLFIFAPIPDGRYAAFALIVGQMGLLGKLVEWAQTGSNRRPTD
jgi:hypothetical protein